MRKINGKAFLFLLVAVAALAAGAAMLYLFQQKRIGESLRWQARRAEEKGDTAQAAKMLQRYLEFNPRDNVERANLARLWVGDGTAGTPRQRLRAIALMDQVLRSDEDPALRRLLVKTAIGVREFAQARDSIKKLLPESDMMTAVAAEREARAKKQALPEAMLRPDAARGELESFWGILLEEEKKPEDAGACYRLAMRHAPEIHASYVRLATLLRRQTETSDTARKALQAEADNAINSLIEKNQAAHEAYLARWRYRREFDLINLRENAGKGALALSEAADDVAQAIKRKPDSVDVLLAAADLERLRGRAAVEDPARSEDQRLAALKIHREKAFQLIARGLDLVRGRKAPGDDNGEFQLLWHKGNMLLDGLDIEPGKGDARAPNLDKQRAEIESVTDSVRKAGIVGAADYMKARLALHERRWAEAAGLFERARSALAAQPDLACQADLYLGACYERLEEPTQMFNAYKRAADWDSASVQAHMGMAAARLLQGQLADAAHQYQVLGKQGRIPTRALLDVARLEMQMQALNEKPDWGNAVTLLDQAATHNPNATVEIALLRAELLVRQGKPSEARETLEKARAGQADEAELWTALAELSLRDKKPEEARKILDEARTKVGDRVPLRLALNRMPDNKTDHSAARDRFTEEEQARLLGGLADAALRANKPAEARRLWGELAKLPRYSGDLRLQLLLFDAALKQNDEKGMKAALDAVAAIERTGGTYQHYGQALAAIWRTRNARAEEDRSKNLEMATRELDAVQQARPSWAALFLARSEVAELSGRPEEAITNLQEAVKNGESSPAVIGRLVSLLTKAGRNDDAQVQLSRLNAAILRDAILGRLAVQVAINRGDVSRALELARVAIRGESREPRDLVFMARVLASNKRFAEAEQKIDEAIKAAPADPEGWLGRVQLLVELKRRPEALAAIAEAAKAIDPARRALALAQCHDAVSQPAESRKHYEAALAAGKSDPAVLKTVAAAHLAAGRPTEAEPLLRTLATKGATPADQEWARRGLAVVLANSTDYKRFTEALELVGLALDTAGRLPPSDERNRPTDLVRAQARVLASQGQRQFRTRAIALFESLERKNALAPDDRFILAVLYDAQGQTSRSQDKLRDLAQGQLRTPRYLAQYAMSLIGKGRTPAGLAEAERIVGMLEDLEKQREVGPNGFASVDLRCRISEARGKNDEALALMEKHIRRDGARPEEVVLLIDVLARQRRFAEAHAKCAEAWKAGKCPPEVIAGVNTSLLQVSSPTDAQVAAVEVRLKTAIEAKPGSTILKLQLADLLDRRGQYPEAATLYRDVLAKEPNNFVAMNNLAWMLAHGGGNAKEALTHIEKALAGMGRRADLLDTRGLIHLALKDPDSAITDLKEAAADGTSAQRLFHLARAHHEAKDKESARTALTRAKDAGLEVAILHPVEQEAARKLLAAYGM